MAIANEIRNEIRKTLTSTTALYAAAGTADLAAEKLRELPATVERLRAEAPERLPRLREQAQTLALQSVGIALEYAVKARETYDGLAERGKTVVEKRRGADHQDAAAAAEEPEVTVERVVTEPKPEPEPEAAEEPTKTAAAEDTTAEASRTRKTATTRRKAPQKKTPPSE